MSSLQRLVSVSLVHPGQGPWHVRDLCPRRGLGRYPRAQEEGQAPRATPLSPPCHSRLELCSESSS